MQGDRSTWPACQAAARQLRAAGQRRLEAPLAALPDSRMLVLYGEPSELKLTGWIAAVDASPPQAVMRRVVHY